MQYALIDTREREGRVQAERETGPGHISLLESRGEVISEDWSFQTLMSRVLVSSTGVFFRCEQGEGLGKRRRLLITKVLGDVTWRTYICLCNARVGR